MKYYAVDARAFLRADYIPHLRLSVVALFPARECVVGVYLYGKVLRRVDVLDEPGQPADSGRASRYSASVPPPGMPLGPSGCTDTSQLSATLSPPSRPYSVFSLFPPQT